VLDLKMYRKINIRIVWASYIFSLFCCYLNAEIVISEFFIQEEEGTLVSDYIEIYNSGAATYLDNWEIVTLAGNQKFSADIKSQGYLLISWSMGAQRPFHNSLGELYYPTNEPLLEETDNYIPNSIYSNVILAPDSGSIILNNSSGTTIDAIYYDVEDGWPVDDRCYGHSLIKRNMIGDSNDINNWSLSPETDHSDWLFSPVIDEEGNANYSRLNFGSPGEENSFKLDFFNDSSAYANIDYKIFGDANNELHFINNYSDPISFSWEGTFSSIQGVDESYNLKIYKTNSITNDNPEILDTLILNTLVFEAATEELELDVLPSDLDIDPLGSSREVANYSWTVSLTKEFSEDYTDTVFSDSLFFNIDAFKYGVYGCTDSGLCECSDGQDPFNCATSDCYSDLSGNYIVSNYPAGCQPDSESNECFEALNYLESANINHDCRYTSLALPKYKFGDSYTGATDNIPIYLDNNENANIDQVAFTFSVEDIEKLKFSEATSEGTIINYTISQETLTNNQFSILLQPNGDILNTSGVLCNLAFEFEGSPGDTTSVILDSYQIISNNYANQVDILDFNESFTKEMTVVNFQSSVTVNGHIVYYSPTCQNASYYFDVSNVEVSMIDDSGFEFIDITDNVGFYEFNNLNFSNYLLNFQKNDDLNGFDWFDFISILNDYKQGTELTYDQKIIRDASLNGFVTAYDISLFAQKLAGIDTVLNELQTEWIFIPNDDSDSISLPYNYIEYPSLQLDDNISRTITAYRLGDADGNWNCNSSNSREQIADKVPYEAIRVLDAETIALKFGLKENTYINALYLEISYDSYTLSPQNIIMNSNLFINNEFQSIENLNVSDNKIRFILWLNNDAIHVSKDDMLGEIIFDSQNIENQTELYFEAFYINEEMKAGGFMVHNEYGNNEIMDGLTLKNELSIPKDLKLDQNYPNPFNPSTMIKWEMAYDGNVSLDIFDIKGNFVKNLFNGYKQPGYYEVYWQADNKPSGLYFYRITLNNEVLQKKMLLIK